MKVTEPQNQTVYDLEYEPSIAPESPRPGGHGEGQEDGDEARAGDGGVHLPAKEEMDLEGVGEHPSAAELGAGGVENDVEGVHGRMMVVYREMLEGAGEAEIRGEHEHAEWLRQQAENLQW